MSYGLPSSGYFKQKQKKIKKKKTGFRANRTALHSHETAEQGHG